MVLATMISGCLFACHEMLHPMELAWCCPVYLLMELNDLLLLPLGPCYQMSKIMHRRRKKRQCTEIHLWPSVHTYDRSPTICGPKKGVLLLVTARLQRLALLSAYQYNIEFLDWHMLMQMGCPSCRLSKKLLQETHQSFLFSTFSSWMSYLLQQNSWQLPLAQTLSWAEYWGTLEQADHKKWWSWNHSTAIGKSYL